MWDSGCANVDGHTWPTAARDAIGLTEAGLVYPGGSLLVRMCKDAEGRPALALGADRDRLLALLAIAFRRPIAASDVMPHVETAANLWRGGDRVLANLRLMFAGLSAPNDPVAGDRVALAACLLNHGWPPAALTEELGLAPGTQVLDKYNPYHVPAGSGRRSGQFDFRSDAITVAEDDDKEVAARELLGQATPKEELEHHEPITPLHPPRIVGGAPPDPKTLNTLPPGIGRGPYSQRSIPAGPSPRPNAQQQPLLNTFGREDGCHSCGTKDPGTRSGNFIGDHQPPTSLNSYNGPQYYFPQCLRCSRAQGGRIKRFKYRGE